MARLTNRFTWDWSPFREILQLRDEMDRFFGNAPRRIDAEFPSVNVWLGPDDLVVTTEIPGVREEDLDISVQGDTLTLRGSRGADTLGENETYHRQERPSGSFVRTLLLPYQVDPDQTEARLEKGVLTLRLSRSQTEKPRHIPVKAQA